MKSCLPIFFTLSLAASLSYADEPQNKAHARETYHNMLGVFLGGHYIDQGAHFTYGLEYHRMLTLPFGFSIIAENTPINKEHNNETELFALATYNFLGHFTMGVGPGIKYEKGEPDRMIGRLTLGHIFHIKPDMEITPNVDFDVNEADSNKIVFGVTFGKQF
ncbi:hypothetical protein Lbir_3030 [Legionella birminghamensis]|uniref:Opacity protein and related surface antigens n=1 Tax=Legionella birminghamensis TaxID=28083 RepID=A0A378IAZ0_9GAMM|nr:hypothetical protein [Legionella birminghamensis]KTC67782.1 hypothetical protein Lbir_3030 [Legionella birminghamensis]STX32046.1 Uncharacterised protein [Legionella birminghamensis]